MLQAAGRPLQHLHPMTLGRTQDTSPWRYITSQLLLCPRLMNLGTHSHRSQFLACTARECGTWRSYMKNVVCTAGQTGHILGCTVLYCTVLQGRQVIYWAALRSAFGHFRWALFKMNFHNDSLTSSYCHETYWKNV